MKATIDAAGRLVVPKGLRDELELEAVDGRLEIAVPSRVRVENGPHGIRFAADAVDSLDSERVRELIERGRR